MENNVSLLGLPTQLVRYFDVRTQAIALGEAGHEMSCLSPRTLSDFFRDTGYDSNLVFEAASICRRLIDAGVMTAAGHATGSPPLSEAYWVIHIPVESFNFPLFDFLALGFPAIHHYFESSVKPVFVVKPSGDLDIGTCFVLENRMLVTARHCIENMNDVSIPDWNPANAPLAAIHVYADEKIDLAILEFERDPFPEIPGFPIGRPAILDEVMVMGYPPVPMFDTALIAETSRIAAVIKSSVGAVVSQPTAYMENQDYLLVSARVKGGNSGGPVIGKRGEVLGLITQLPAGEDNRSDLLGYAAALPSKMITDLIDGAAQNLDDIKKLDFQPIEEGFSTRRK